MESCSTSRPNLVCTFSSLAQDFWGRSCVELSGEPTPEEPPVADVATDLACSNWMLSSFTRFSNLCSLCMTPSAAGSTRVELGALRFRDRAHLGGRSAGGNTQAILARRQFEHGTCLSQRTLRLRQTTQLRSLGFSLLPEVSKFARFSASEAEGAVGSAPDGPCDMQASVLLDLVNPTSGVSVERVALTSRPQSSKVGHSNGE